MHTPLSLRELQNQFLAALYDAAASGPVGSIAGNGLAPEARLGIYRHSFNETQTAALRIGYPAVLALVGEAWFDQTARSYRRAHPSDSGNLQGFGARLADYLETLPACRNLAYLPDVARLEWLRQQTILAAESKSITSDIFAQSLKSTDESLRITLHPSLHLLGSQHAILTIWRFATQPSPEKLTLDGDGENVLLWREDGKVVMAALDPASFACIATLAQGHSLQEAYADAAGFDPDFDLAMCVESLLQRGLIAGIRPFAVSCKEP